MKKGDRVVMTVEGYERLINKWARPGRARITSGIFVGYSKTAYCIRVLRDEHKEPCSYHEDFWEPVK